MRPTLLSSLLTCTTALAGTPALAGTGYTFVDLGTLGGDHSGAMGMNDQGQIVGWSTIPGCTTGNGAPCKRAFLWENGVMTDLGFLAGDEGSIARAINDNGLIVGNSERDVLNASGTYHAVTFSVGNAPTPLPDLGHGTSWASDVNESGVIVGYATDPNSFQDRVLTWQGGVLTNLGSTEPHSYNRGTGINDNGQVIGMAWNLFQPNDSILYDNQWFQIGGYGQFENSEGFDLNNNGMAVGTQAFPSGNWHATIWQLGQPGATDLGVLPGDELSYLLDVNDSGEAVGYSLDEDNGVSTRAIYTDGVTLTNLNDLLPVGTNALLWDATEINEGGDIVGSAVVNGAFHAYLLRKDDAGGNYCTPTANSTGQAAEMNVMGSSSISTNDLELSAQPVPNKPFLFFYGPTQVEVPFGDGFRCAGGGIQRLGPVAVASGNRATRVVDLVTEGIQPGSLNFQCWFRDSDAGGAGFNLSDGYEVVFLP